MVKKVKTEVLFNVCTEMFQKTVKMFFKSNNCRISQTAMASLPLHDSRSHKNIGQHCSLLIVFKKATVTPGNTTRGRNETSTSL